LQSDFSTDISASRYCIEKSMGAHSTATAVPTRNRAPESSCSREREAALEVRDLLSVRDALTARVCERRTSIRSALEAAGVSYAAALAEAPCSTLRLFLDSNERDRRDFQGLHSLAQDLKLSSFVVRAGVSVEISHGLRLRLRLQLNRLAALAHALESVESQLANFAYRLPLAASR
jgi:hypothetical protein